MGILDALRDPQFRQDVKTNARSFGQSASNTLAGNVAAPLDLIALALRKAGIPVPEPVGGSQWMANQGLTREVPDGASKVAGEAFGLIAPLAGAPQSAAAIARGLRQMEENAFNPAMLNKQAGAILADYQGAHKAPMKNDSTAALHELNKIYPDDIYSSNAARYYGHYGDNRDFEAVRLMQAAKDKPNMPVTMYRAVPYKPSPSEELLALEKQMAKFMATGKAPDGSKGSAWYNAAYDKRDELRKAAELPFEAQKMTINNGDWVTLSKNYAKEHGESALGGQYKIISKKVPARKLFTDANSIQEFGYDESGKALLAQLGLLGGGAAGLAYGMREK